MFLPFWIFAREIFLHFIL